MKWFKHATDAHDSNNLTKVRMKFGADGYAIYWYCLELIAGDLGVTEAINFELKHDAEVIGFNLKIDTLRVEEIMRYMVKVGLFEDAHGTISCLKLARDLDKNTTRNKSIHRIIDAAASVPDCLGQSQTIPDCLGLSELDLDRDIDIKEILPKGSTKKKRVFKPPSLDEIKTYISEKEYQHVNFDSFFYHYEAKGWMVGKTKMKNWRAAISNWESRAKSYRGNHEAISRNSKPESNIERLNRSCIDGIREP